MTAWRRNMAMLLNMKRSLQSDSNSFSLSSMPMIWGVRFR